MRSLRRKIGLSGLLLVVFIIGCVVGVMTSSYLYYRHVFSKVVDENASDLIRQINTLCKLRLGEVESVIDDLETRVDTNVRSVALTSHIPRTDYRHGALRTAKTYREIYPSRSEIASEANDALKGIAKFETFKCESSLSRLVKQAGPDSNE